ncbi:uncharacterized protein LOC143887465 [Tasmannia lanceolata]|uniref:uncharacterized protein LOC143887456 n=1 Tax=Tasmannia lanceolata TaxID=3420 RepID=UPI0040636A74
MANPSRRNSNPSSENQQSQSFSSLIFFLKRPQAFPLLLFIFILLTWVTLRFQHSTQFFSQFQQSQQGQQWSKESDANANLVRFSSELPSQIFRDKRGWLLNPVIVAHEAGISGGVQLCISVHVGEIRPGGVRGNHRHHTCNETFIIWGAKTKFRLESSLMVEKGYTEVVIGAEEIAVASSPSGTAHALVNVDNTQKTFFLGCQDSIISPNRSNTDFKVWKDL